MNEWTILVVEDEADGRDVVQHILNMFDISVIAVETAENALISLQERSFTAAIIDLALPGMGGIELVSTIRNNQGSMEMPCIAMTAFHSSSVKKEALDAGFDAYFSKPINARSFVDNLGFIIS